MKKIIIVKQIFKILYPELNVVVRYNKNKKFEIILKNVKKTYNDGITFKTMLFIPNKNDLILEDFIDSLFGYCGFLNEENCAIKHLSKNGSSHITIHKI